MHEKVLLLCHGLQRKEPESIQELLASLEKTNQDHIAKQLFKYLPQE